MMWVRAFHFGHFVFDNAPHLTRCAPIFDFHQIPIILRPPPLKLRIRTPQIPAVMPFFTVF